VNRIVDMLGLGGAPELSADHVSGFRVIESDPEVVHLEAVVPLMHVVLVGRKVEPTRRMLTTILHHQRPVMARLVWAAMRTPNVADKAYKKLTEADRPGRRHATQADRKGAHACRAARVGRPGLSRYGHGSLVLEQVADAAGSTRGARYRQVKDKQDLALAVTEWSLGDLDAGGWRLIEQEQDPLAACSPWRAVTRSSAVATWRAWRSC
jgi:hypothetical protein